MERDTETVAERTVRAVATTTKTDPVELPPLYEAIEPDALGDVVDGMDVVETIGDVDTDPSDRPIDSVVLESVEIHD